ncbi:MAG: molybdopterin-dependent oxidoreductase [Acidimicrobiia bacterium]
MSTRLREDERLAAVLGVALGAAFVVSFATGLLSHLAQNPPSWFSWPARPAGLYRVTQGLHVVVGIATIPLLLAKLWVVYPKFLRWPPAETVPELLERASLVPLVGGGLFLVGTGLANINGWYPWPFGFRLSHYWVAWVTVGALTTHVLAKWATTRDALAGRTAARLDVAPGQLDRRGFLGLAFGASGLLVMLTAGQTVRPLERLALLAPRRPSVGPQGFPVNKSAEEAEVEELLDDAEYRLVVDGRVPRPLRLTREQLTLLPQHEAVLPIACVEGWSVSKRWRGVRVRDLLDQAGAADHATARVHSLQRSGAYNTSELNREQTEDPDTLLAVEVEGEPLHRDHGYPVRLIGPNRPGVQQTKWVERVEVL